MENTVQDLVNEYHDRPKVVIYEAPRWAMGGLYVAGVDPYRTDNTSGVGEVVIYRGLAKE